MQVDNVEADIHRDRHRGQFLEILAISTTAFRSPATAGAVHQNPAHHIRRRAEEMSPAVPSRLGLIDQPQIRFMNQRRTRKRLRLFVA